MKLVDHKEKIDRPEGMEVSMVNEDVSPLFLRTLFGLEWHGTKIVNILPRE